MSEKKTLEKAALHPQVIGYVNPGLSGKTLIDNVIGGVERAIFDQRTHDGLTGPLTDSLTILLDTLKEEYPAHFSSNHQSQPPYPEAHHKNPAYKACNGF